MKIVKLEIHFKTDASGKCSPGSLSGIAMPALGLAPVGAAQTASNTFPPSFDCFEMNFFTLSGVE